MNLLSLKKSIFWLVGLSLVTVAGAPDVQYKQGSSISNHHQTIYYGASYHTNRAWQEESVIAWDLNGVVFMTKFGAKEVIFGAIKKFGPINGFYRMIKLSKLKSKINAERAQQGLEPYAWEQLMYVLLRSKDPKMIEHVQFVQACIERADSLDFEVARIIYELSQGGHKQGVLSNMWENNLNIQINMLTRLAGRNQHEMQHVHHVLSVVTLLVDASTRVIPTAENNWVHKTETASYQLFLEKNKKQTDALTVFIDDNPENVRAAVERGGFDVGIVFIDAASLRNVLENLQVLPMQKQVEEVGACAAA